MEIIGYIIAAVLTFIITMSVVIYKTKYNTLDHYLSYKEGALEIFLVAIASSLWFITIPIFIIVVSTLGVVKALFYLIKRTQNETDL